MVAHVSLLPPNASPLERLFSDVKDPLAALGDAYEGIRVADRSPPPAFLAYLVWEYGLGELSPFLPNLYDLIGEGLQWQRVRGTPAAIARGLSWLGYGGAIVEAPSRRRRWNRFQVRLGRVRNADFPDLPRLNGIIDLSPPQRSKFHRGFRDYDVPPAEGSWTRGSAAMGSNFSGVVIEPGKAKWSFGRSHDFARTLQGDDLSDLGVWIPLAPASEVWASDIRVWSTLPLPWAEPAALTRTGALAAAVAAKPCHVRLARADGSVIGFARATSRPVREGVPGGEYEIGGTRFGASGPFDAVLVRARTRFGDGAGNVATSATLVFDAALAPGVPPGRAFLVPGEISGGVALAPFACSIPLGLTVREHMRCLLRISTNSLPTGRPFGLTLALTRT